MPLIVFDGSSSHSGSLKVNKPDVSTVSPVTDRLKPPPAANLSNPIRRLNSSSSSSSASNRSTDANLKREANSPVGIPYVSKMSTLCFFMCLKNVPIKGRIRKTWLTLNVQIYYKSNKFKTLIIIITITL